MKELLTAKANIDRILELDKEQEEANERREKEAEVFFREKGKRVGVDELERNFYEKEAA